jgi:hypothetical protein
MYIIIVWISPLNIYDFLLARLALLTLLTLIT